MFADSKTVSRARILAMIVTASSAQACNDLSAESTVENTEDSESFLSRESVTLDTRDVTRQILCPARTGGDREFGGVVNSWAEAYIEPSADGNQLNLRLYFRVQEPRPDWSAAEGWFGPFIVYRAPPRKRISAILSSRYSKAHLEQPYNTEYWGYHYVTPSEGDLVQYFQYKTDTKGKDIGNCTPDDAHIKDVVFNAVQVMLVDQ